MRNAGNGLRPLLLAALIALAAVVGGCEAVEPARDRAEVVGERAEAAGEWAGSAGEWAEERGRRVARSVAPAGGAGESTHEEGVDDGWEPPRKRAVALDEPVVAASGEIELRVVGVLFSGSETLIEFEQRGRAGIHQPQLGSLVTRPSIVSAGFFYVERPDWLCGEDVCWWNLPPISARSDYDGSAGDGARADDGAARRERRAGRRHG